MVKYCDFFEWIQSKFNCDSPPVIFTFFGPPKWWFFPQSFVTELSMNFRGRRLLQKVVLRFGDFTTLIFNDPKKVRVQNLRIWRFPRFSGSKKNGFSWARKTPNFMGDFFSGSGDFRGLEAIFSFWVNPQLTSPTKMHFFQAVKDSKFYGGYILQ